MTLNKVANVYGTPLEELVKLSVALQKAVSVIDALDEDTGDWVTITYDDFEKGWGNYVDGGSYARISTGGAHQGKQDA
eukprot:CAMPEP_0172495808 /NCGR_PEP_ID=MMETSP1066-20121228/77691_1 /TAXON_ID=671091 /ORGANISM="Coscinodiscus wailesii, Strain CCMP2513" /LENGTH=77 /DNA_ID=CAMNT_0013267743 /DNA_START=82 /DNA_END=312 /DNA_ORIENTATION=-